MQMLNHDSDFSFLNVNINWFLCYYDGKDHQ